MRASTEMILMPCSAANTSRSGRLAMRPSARITSQMTPAGNRPASLQRSRIASVWPARSSTPPTAARSGKVCPGLAKSLGLACSSQSRRMVVARSKALIPVVTPWPIASMVTVNAVPKRDVLSSTMAPTPSSSSRHPSQGTQMRPRPCVAMKLTASGVMRSAAMARSPSFSRSSSSTMITNLPARMSAMASSTLARLIRLLPVQSRGEHRDALPRGKRPSHVASDEVDLEVDPGPHRPLTGGGGGDRVRNQRDGERRLEDVDDGQADAVDGDAALLCDELGHRLRCCDRHPPGVAILAERAHRAGRVDVAGEQMPADAVTELQRALEVDGGAGIEVGERGPVPGLGHDVGAESAGCHRGDREAGAVHGDALTDPEAGERRARRDLHTPVSTEPCVAERLHNAAEHVFLLPLSVHSTR